MVEEGARGRLVNRCECDETVMRRKHSIAMNFKRNLNHVHGTAEFHHSISPTL